MKIPSLPRFFALLAAIGTIAVSPSIAQPTTYNDAIGDIDVEGNTNPGDGTLDIVKMEVTDTSTDIIFTMTVNGNIAATDWGNFMIGIANQKIAGGQIGNGWARPINMNAGGTNGMTHWIGSWVNGGGGAQLWAYTGSGTDGGTGNNWNNTGAIKAFVPTGETQSTLTYTVTKASLGVETGDTIIFDAYSSGSGGADGALDALSNPDVTISTWSGNYTSEAPTISSYTLSNSALNTTQNITFSVDMNAQIAIGAFDPAVDIVSADWGEEFTLFVDLADPDGDGVYTGTTAVTAAIGTPVPYRYTIVPADTSLPLDSETVARSFLMPTDPLSLATVFFDNAQGYRNVTFTVDMSVQEATGLFNPATQTVEVRGSFNNFGGGNTLTAQGSGIYSATLTIGGAPDQSVEYKFYAAGPGAAGYEAIQGNRTFTLTFNQDGAPNPPIDLPVVFFSNQDVVPQNRPVTFSVDMTVLEAAGGFTPGVDSLKVVGSFNNWDTGGTAYQLADPEEDGIYTGTFSIVGDADTSISYKFFNSRAGAPNGGYENDPNRTAVLGIADEPQVLPTVYWNNDSGQQREITFSVDMTVQAAKGLFDPDTGTVQLRGIGSFNEGDAKPLAREGVTLVYSGTFVVPGDAGAGFAYKFFSSGLTASGFEIINPDDLFQNRTVTLGPAGELQVLPLAYFSNELFYVTGTPLGAFSTTEGTSSAAQSVTVDGQGLTAGIVATAPAGFEVSSDGITYGTTATITPVSGSVTAATLSVRIAASAAAGSPAGDVALTSDGSQPVNIAVTGTVTASSGYGSWASGFGLDPAVTTGPTAGAPGADPDGDNFTNEQEYAFGTNPTAGSASLLDTEASGGNLTVTWLQRGDVTYAVQGTDNLAATPFAGLTVTITDGPSIPEPAAGYSRKQFTAPATGRNFYRIQATVPGN